MVLFLDMNSYFASVEQQHRPELRGVPVGVIPNDCETTCCIAASYEAKAHGINTGTGVREARATCPSVKLVLSRPDLYIETHDMIIKAVESIHPNAKPHSIDEMSFKLRGPDQNPEMFRRIAMDMKTAIRDQVGEWMRCSIGVAPNVMLAKTASEMVKPDGMVVFERSEIPQRLYTLKITDLPGINTGIETRLKRHGIYTLPQLCTATKKRLREAWGSVVGELWYDWLHGRDPYIKPEKRKNIGHQHVLAPELRYNEQARAVAIRLLMKASTRMRSERYWCTKITLGVDGMEPPYWSSYQNLEPCQCTKRLLKHLDALWEQHKRTFVLRISVTLGGLIRNECVERPLFEEDRKGTELATTLDKINGRYGHAKVYYASMHDARKAAPRRIPFGSVPDLKLPDHSE